MDNTPYIGDPRDASLIKTIQVFTNKIQRISPLKGKKFLDVGCGDGSFTIPLAKDYEDVFGIDVQQPFLDVFQKKVNGNPKFHVMNMSAEDMAFEDKYFDTIITIETVEHIPDLKKAAAEMWRVLKPGGELIITCPNRLFPFENHGMRLGKKELHTRVPLLPYLPFLHTRLALARVFTVNSLDKLLTPLGFEREKVDYIWPTFEHGGNIFTPVLKPFFKVMRKMEESPLRLFGTSILTRYIKK